MVRSTQPPLSQLLICQAFPAVAQCTLHTDDNATMQVPARALGEGPHSRVRPKPRPLCAGVARAPGHLGVALWKRLLTPRPGRDMGLSGRLFC